jgi:hypothetical protein
MEFYEGMRVRPNPENKHYEQFIRQHRDNYGTILKNKLLDSIYTERGWVHVKWDHNESNVYPPEMLLPVEEVDKVSWDFERLDNDPAKHKKEEKPMENYPLLPGERVQLNPECQLYKDYNYKLNGGAGYVLKHEDMDRMFKWKSTSLSTRNASVATVNFDSGVSLRVHYRDLLRIEAKPINVILYNAGFGDNYILDTEKTRKQLDNDIIVNGIKISKFLILDDEWRENTKKDIDNYK